MPLFSKVLNEQHANGVCLFVDGYAITQHEIEASAHVLPCCRSSGLPCAPPSPRPLQTNGYTTPDLPPAIIRRIRVLRYGCTHARKSGWTDPPCAATHPIKEGDRRQYIRYDDPSCQTLRQSGWGSKKSEAVVAAAAGPAFADIVEASGLSVSEQTQVEPQAAAANSNASTSFNNLIGQPNSDLVRSICIVVTSLGRLLSALNPGGKQGMPLVPNPSMQTAAATDQSTNQAEMSAMAAVTTNQGDIPVPAPPMQGYPSLRSTPENLAESIQGFDLVSWMSCQPPTE